MDKSQFAITVIQILLVVAIIIFVLQINLNTRRLIKRWATENDVTILWTAFIPWYSRWFGAGIHPANFKVQVKDSKDQIKTYQITGGGLFGFSDKISVKEITK